MPIKFSPNYTITPKIANCLVRIEAVKERITNLSLSPKLLTSLRESARLYTTHYSTMIEGNNLSPEQIKLVLKHEGHFPGRERDESEVKGYYEALTQIEQWVSKNITITENTIKLLHALVMSNGKTKVKPTPYRDGQNVIKDARTNYIVYLPPEAGDVPILMKQLVNWIDSNTITPCPIIAAIAHYQFATIHPYYDGNGRTARLLTTLVLHLGGYGLKGLYSLEEYYALNLGNYYQAISIGDSHNYYMGREEADITPWIEYFIEGMTISFENVLKHMQNIEGDKEKENLLRELDPKQRKALDLFQEYESVTAKQIGALFGFKERTSSLLCANWVSSGFIEIVDFSKKGRKYKISSKYQKLI